MHFNISLSQDLRRNPYTGKYYAFEGIDGSGKSTQLEKTRKYLELTGKRVITTSEPTGEGEIQQVIRDTLYAKLKIPSRAYQNLYSADRGLNHSEIVEPALKNGDIVLSHRSFWSAVAYGILDLGEEYDTSRASSILISQGIFSKFHQFLAPDKTFYLKVSASHAAKRLIKMEKEKDIYEKESKLAKIVTGYERVSKEFADEFIIVDGEKDEDEITKEIISHL